MKKHIYFAACDESDKGGIYHFEQQNDGSLEKKGFYRLDRPMYLTIFEDRMYALLRAPFAESEYSGVVSFKINADGSLSGLTECLSTEGACACHITVDEGEIYCVNYLSGSVIKIGQKLVTNFGKGPNAERQERAHTHYVNTSPCGKYMLVTDLGLDTIFIYDKDLNEVSRARVPSGHGVRHLAYSEDGKTVFSANELESTVSAFEYDIENGRLELRDTLGGLPTDFSGISTMAAVRVCDGFVYASNRGHDSLSRFRYSDGKLTLVDITGVGGRGPRDFDFVGDYVYSTNEQTNNVTVLKNNGGKLTLLPFEYEMPDPLCVVSVDK